MANWVRVKVLGRGSYGVVFLATPTTGPLHYVAIKVASMENSSSLIMEEHILQRFTGCPEIVQCIGSEITMELEEDSFDSKYYNLILEYAAGGTLADLIKQHKKLRENEVKEYLRMILRGLSCVHRQGFVHADLKPANILAFPQNDGKMKLKIADFGLSMISKEVEEACNFEPRFRGTPKYMSPESVVFGKINPPLDIWSVGCILVEMISGKQVWDGCKNRKQLISKLVHEMEIPDIPEELSKEGRDFLGRCFDYNSTRRWTADMLLQHPYLIDEDQKVVKKGDDQILPVSTQLWSLPNLPEMLIELFKEETNFLERCFELNSRRKLTANMLLQDPYLLEEKKFVKKDDEILPIPVIPTQLWSLSNQPFNLDDLLGFHTLHLGS